MIVIRGATTIEKDEPSLIQSAVENLLRAVFEKNALTKEEVRCFVFSLTSDIHSYHPAKAARECGYDFAPLFACVEPEIDGGLKLCIRLMLIVERVYEKKAVHIYQEGAKILRKDLSSIYNIAIDGPAGSGKSTVAKILARDYNILYLDTGAMYRTCALKAIQLGIDTKDGEKISRFINNINLEVKYIDGNQHTFLDGEDVSSAIRENAVSMAASNISAHHCVRVKMVEMQREIAKKMSCVLDGRDIGTAVLPNADFKFYVTANSKVRAQRRFDELALKGEVVEFEKLHEEILARDKQDSEREFSPLVCAEDAIVVDTSDKTIEEVIAIIKEKIQKEI